MAVLSESVEVQGDAMGTQGFDQGAYEDVVRDLEIAKDRKKQALRLLGELGAARRLLRTLLPLLPLNRLLVWLRLSKLLNGSLRPNRH